MLVGTSSGDGRVAVAENAIGTCASSRATPDATSCEACSLKPGCLARSLVNGGLTAFSNLARLKRTISRGSHLVRAGNALTSLYVVRRGTFKGVTLSHDGRPKITGFYLPGDIIGLDAIGASAHPCDSTALEEGEVCVLPLVPLETLASSLPELLKELVRALSAEITRDRRIIRLLGSMDAEQRVARFLVSLAERYHHLGYSSDSLLLHMTRDDIASYLGLSSETVSRVLARLRRNGVLDVRQRQIRFSDCGRLEQLADW